MGKRLADAPCVSAAKADRTILRVFRWLNRSRLVVARLLAFCVMAVAGLVSCATPALARSGHEADKVLACPARLLGQPLRNGQVLDGPPQDIAILRGDDLPARGHDIAVIWRVRYIYQRGGTVSLECEYAKVGKAYLAITARVNACRFTQHGDVVRLSCN